MRDVVVADIMTREPITIKPDTNLLECAKKMVRKRVGSLVITEKKRLLGIITETDILWALVKKPNGDLSKVNAIDISAKKITSIKPTMAIEKAIEKMKSKRFDRLPVVQDGELVGLITVKDILNFNPEIYTEFEELRGIREEEEKLKRIEKTKGFSNKEGICEECGKHGFLIRQDGMMICESCRRKK